MHLLILVFIIFGPNFLTGSLVKRKDHYCNVQDERSSFRFDFSKLTNEEDHNITYDKNEFLRLQLCKPLKQICDGKLDYSICLSKNGKEIGIGKEPPMVIKEFGEIIFKYTGDKCDNTTNYTVDIKMICDLAVKDFAPSLARGYNECKFNMEWRTNAACTEPARVNCTLDDKSGHYDLSSLTNLSNNYEVSINDTYTVLLNVCHSILYGKYTCVSNSAACLINKSSVNELGKPLGEPKESLRFNPKDNSLSLTYTEGALCNRNIPNGSALMQTTITFICDLDAIGTSPKYVGGMENCHFNFVWKTASACNEQSLHNKSLEKVNTDVCAVKNPLTNEIYNLTALMNREFSVIPFGIDEIYKFSICGPISNTNCTSGTGACRLHSNISGGIANSQLMWKESGPYLNYTNGDMCNHKKIHKKRYTIIEFYCGPQDNEIEENDLCFDVIKMSTNHVCKKENMCATFNNEISFEPLIRQEYNYLIKTDNEEYHINVCRSLVPEKGLSCNDGAICKTIINDGKVIKTLNLGHAVERPGLSSDLSAVLIYRNGSVCEEDKKRRIESSISFLCDINNKEGTPQFKKYNNCTYYFEWKTHIVCGKKDGTFNKNCSITNPIGDYRNLSILNGAQVPIHQVTGTESQMYSINFCQNKQKLSDAFIYDNNKNYGTKVNVLFDYTVDLIYLQFTEGSKCSDGSLARSSITIICKDTFISNTPVLIREEPCRVDFEWYTNKICRSFNIPEFSTTETAITAQGGEITGIVILIVVILVAICYFQNASRRLHFKELISNSATRTCDRVKYSRVCRKKRNQSTSELEYSI